MKAILSDIHGNLEALQSVLVDADRHGVEAIYCLGDLVGYGPNPRECVDLAMRWPVVLLGDHDQTAVPGQADCVLRVNRAVLWARCQLDAPVPDSRAADRRLRFLGGRPLTHREADLLFVHASPRGPLTGDIVPEDVYCPPKMVANFALVERCCFVGHTHLPGVFTDDLQFYGLEEVGPVYRLDRRKTVCNVGSVGQPRDGDPRACYALLDSDTIRFRRVEYDVAMTVRKIHEADGLENIQGDRLLAGR